MCFVSRSTTPGHFTSLTPNTRVCFDVPARPPFVDHQCCNSSLFAGARCRRLPRLQLLRFCVHCKVATAAAASTAIAAMAKRTTSTLPHSSPPSTCTRCRTSWTMPPLLPPPPPATTTTTTCATTFTYDIAHLLKRLPLALLVLLVLLVRLLRRRRRLQYYQCYATTAVAVATCYTATTPTSTSTTVILP